MRDFLRRALSHVDWVDLAGIVIAVLLIAVALWVLFGFHPS
jgi:hypothetical protein